MLMLCLDLDKDTQAHIHLAIELMLMLADVYVLFALPHQKYVFVFHVRCFQPTQERKHCG